MKGSVFPYKTELQTYLQSFNSSFDLSASWDNRFKQVDRILNLMIPLGITFGNITSGKQIKPASIIYRA